MIAMNLYVDAGNQYVKWICGTRRGRFPTRLETLETNFREHWDPLIEITSAYVSNVAGEPFFDLLRQWVSCRPDTSLIKVTPKKKQCGVRNNYADIAELGADRWSAVVGVRSLTRQSAIVVDCGTAITIDAIDSSGVFLGGSILPGFYLSESSLWTRASGITEFQDSYPKIPGKTTRQAVSGGVSIGLSGAVDRLIKAYTEVVEGSPQLFLAGGDAKHLKKFSEHIFIDEPDIVLKGIIEIANSMEADTI